MHENDTQLIVSLLQQTTTLPIVQNYLKKKGLPFSGTWAEIYSKRILPSIIEGTLKNSDLISLLNEVEEYGNQHIFLYQCTDVVADSLMNEKNTEQKIIDSGLSDALYKPNHLAQPNDPVVSEIRWERGEVKELIFKIKETRVFEVHDGDTRENNVLIKKYNLIRKRVVTLASMHANGCLEIRIPSQSGNYLLELKQVFNLIKILSKADFSPISLTKAKENIWEDRINLSHCMRLSNSHLRNDQGVKIIASTGSKTDDLALNAGAVSGLQGFLNHNGDYEGANIWLKQIPSLLSEDIHININGELNEFAVPANCSKSDYQYVLNKLKKLNASVS